MHEIYDSLIGQSLDSLENLKFELKKCERRCKACGKLYLHLFDNNKWEDGSISGCMNSVRKEAIKRVIAKRLRRQNDSSNQEGTKV